jgi:hypothetical protein
MKKIMFVFLFLLLSMFCTTSLFALRLGLEFGNPTAVIIIRPEPFDIKIGYSFSDIFGTGNMNFLHISGDYRVIDSYRIVDFLHFFLSVGAYVQIYMAGGDTPNEGDTDIYAGARIPIGLQAFLFKKTLEIFVEIAPVVDFIPAINFDIGRAQGYLGFTIRVPF